MPVVEVSATLHCDTAHAYAQWLEVVWRKGGGLGAVTMLEPGDPHTGVGSLRKVTGGIQEKILHAQPPSKVTYTVVSGASLLFPVVKHLGEVSFIPSPSSAGPGDAAMQGSGTAHAAGQHGTGTSSSSSSAPAAGATTTTVQWRCTFTPACWGIEWLVRAMIWFSFTTFLRTLAASVNGKKKA